jgi:hypothetical protein
MKSACVVASSNSSSLRRPFLETNLFTEMPYDYVTGLYFFGTGFYDPTIGRSIQQDLFAGILPNPLSRLCFRVGGIVRRVLGGGMAGRLFGLFLVLAGLTELANLQLGIRYLTPFSLFFALVAIVFLLLEEAHLDEIGVDSDAQDESRNQSAPNSLQKVPVKEDRGKACQYADGNGE